MVNDAPPLPKRINGLWQLAFNLWWTWHWEAREVFRRLDYPLWRLTSHNPVRMLQTVPYEHLNGPLESRRSLLFTTPRLWVWIGL